MSSALFITGYKTLTAATFWEYLRDATHPKFKSSRTCLAIITISFRLG